MRYGVVTGLNVTREKVAAYLPGNYRVVGGGADFVVVGGRDPENSGFGLDSYVIPRLGSGWMACREVAADDPRLAGVKLAVEMTKASLLGVDALDDYVEKLERVGCRYELDAAAGTLVVFDGDRVCMRGLQKGFGGPWICRFFDTENVKWAFPPVPIPRVV